MRVFTCLAALASLGMLVVRPSTVESVPTATPNATQAQLATGQPSELERQLIDGFLAKVSANEPGLVRSGPVGMDQFPSAAAITAIVECGSSAGFFNTVTAVGFGAGPAQAQASAKSKAELDLWDATDAKCSVCPDGVTCNSGIVTLDGNWSFGPAVPAAGGGFKVKATYSGAYAFVCDPCSEDPI